MKKSYITTAIPYVNERPHIGHAMDYLLADIWARYHGAPDKPVRFSAGLDEHGTKVAQKAAEAGVSPQEFVDDLAPSFRTMIDRMNVGVTDFIRTTDPDHERRVQEIWKKLDAAGVIYKGTYEGWYCSGCENFVTESEAKVLDFTCPDHAKPFEKLSEDNYFLKVSQFTDRLREFIESAVVPEFRGRELLELIKDGARDVSISRPKEKLSWGVPVPGDANHVMYVWVDALSNYITVLGYPETDDYKQWWPANVQVIGKDILRFHAIIWPTILMALELPLPEKILAHGFVNVNSAKMSKSIGNVIDPLAIIDEYGADAFRYFFARHIPTFDDGDFTWEKFEAAYNGELANDLGNLVSRVAQMINKYADGKIVHGEIDTEPSAVVRAKMDQFDFAAALEKVWESVQMDNKYIDDRKPWEIAKLIAARLKNPDLTTDEAEKIVTTTTYREETLTDPARVLQVILRVLTDDLLHLSHSLAPFLPDTAAKIRDIFGGDKLPVEIPILFPKKYLYTDEPARK
ncbi:methionine--tRNA ligase [Candidatus Saccharibacteria bacterium]|nr:methionine--tRNA ligase [Candidatus Saccharibacteria bacterium]